MNMLPLLKSPDNSPVMAANDRYPPNQCSGNQLRHAFYHSQQLISNLPEHYLYGQQLNSTMMCLDTRKNPNQSQQISHSDHRTADRLHIPIPGGSHHWVILAPAQDVAE